jgi:hypothetical protein
LSSSASREQYQLVGIAVKADPSLFFRTVRKHIVKNSGAVKLGSSRGNRNGISIPAKKYPEFSNDERDPPQKKAQIRAVFSDPGS